MPRQALTRKSVACFGAVNLRSGVFVRTLYDVFNAVTFRGLRAGVAAALVRTGKGRQTEQLPRAAGVPVYDDLLQLARALAAGRPSVQ